MNFPKRLLVFTLIAVLASILAAGGCVGQKEGGGEAGDISTVPGGTSPGNSKLVKSVVSSEYSGPEAPPAAGESSGKSKTEGPQASRTHLGVPAAEARTQPRGGKVAYLTFDDGPNSQYTEKILDILRRKKVKASFVVVGKNVKLNPSIFQRILADGHAVVNHTYSHDYSVIYRSPEAFLSDLGEANKVITQYTGKPVMLFRAPGGPDKLGPEFTAKLRSHGYISVGWNISAVDTDPRGVTQADVYNNIVSGLERVERLKLSPIILMHDGTQLATTDARPGSPLAIYIQNREATLAALPAVIDHFRSKGYTFAVVDESTPPAW